jgi:hypothetical protein
MRLHCDVVCVPRPDGIDPRGQDAYGFDERAGLVAVCDGAGSLFAAGDWARCLVRRFVADPEPLLYGDPGPWVAAAAADWRAGLDLDTAGDRVRRAAAGGSGATIAAIRGVPHPDGYRLDVAAVGDTFVFVVRRGLLCLAHPPLPGDTFPARPQLVTTSDPDPPARTSVELQPGDTIAIATDATARWVTGRGATFWPELATLPADRLAHALARRRDEGEIADDDLTLVRCHLR